MSQSDTVSYILERITQETAQVTTKKKIFGMKSKRTAKPSRPQKKVVLDNSSSSSSTANSMSPATSPFRIQPNQIPPRSQSMPLESINNQNQDNITSPSSSMNISENSTNSLNSISNSNDIFFDDQWSIISPCIDNIFEQGSEGRFEPAFQAVERLCRSKQYCENLNDQLLLKIDSFANIISQKLHSQVNFQTIISVLDFIQRANALLASIFSTFERSFLAPQLTIEQLVLKHITKAIHSDQNIVDGICKAIVDEIHEQRQESISKIESNFNNENIKTNDIKTQKNPQTSTYQQTAFLISQFDLTKDIINPLEAETTDFYSKIKLNDKSSQLLLKHINLIIDNEEQIINFFTSDIQKICLSCTRDNIYVKRFTNELPQIIRTLMNSKDSANMTLLSTLVSNSLSENLLKIFVLSFSNDLRQRCEVILSISSESIKSANSDIEKKDDLVIPELIQIHSTMVDCKEVIGKKPSDAIFRSFKNTINEVTFKVAFLLAKYCHELILNDPSSFIASTTRIVNLFRELESMDVFFTHYKEFLTVRLLKGIFARDANNDESEACRAEKGFLDKIEGNCGEDDVAPMREMIKNAEMWPNMNSKFNSIQKHDQNENKSVSIYFQTFNSSQFQQYSNYTLSANEDTERKEGETNKFFSVPKEVMKARSEFSKFYIESSPRKSLKWLPLLDQVTIQLNNSTINGSSLYYFVLDSIINGRPLKESGIDEETLKELVEALVQTKIILNDEKSDNVKIFDRKFSIASNDEKKVVSLPNPSLIRPKMLKNEKMSDIFAMRQTRIEAALVLAMKKLKTAKKETLFEKMKDNVNFRASNEDLEKCLDNLITKSYFFKDEEGNIVFTTE